MTLKRIIPCLNIFEGKLIKTIKFNLKEYTYLGDVLNTVKIFNENKAEELIIKDIGATINNTPPRYKLIERISNISRMPICYGGGIKTIDQAKILLESGIEKISISTSAINNIDFINQLSNKIGMQSVSVTLDYKKINNDYIIFTSNGKVNTQKNLFDFIEIIKDSIGELTINDIDRDGTMIGPDYNLIEKVYSQLKIPLVVMGGFGTIDEISLLFNKYNQIGAACGSLFVFKGKNRAVLINYPRKEILDKVQQI